MEISGLQFIGYTKSGKGHDQFYGINPKTNKNIKPVFLEASKEEIKNACDLSVNAFYEFRKTSSKNKAEFLNEIASEIDKLGNNLIDLCSMETGLSKNRLIGERARTMNQLSMFADLIMEGNHLDARIDTAIPGRKPVPKSDLRQMQIPLGPVGVFSATNFPLAFSVTGGDTASALAAGCTVVVKANPSHPETSELVASAIVSAAKKTGMPDGIFSMIHGKSNHVGLSLVKHPAIKAIGFTGSFKGGKALFETANLRKEPIPVYAEMGSVNPVFILPDALKQKTADIANGLVQSVTLGAGQFCTNPGICFSINSDARNDFLKKLKHNIENNTGNVMLNERISNSYFENIEKVKNVHGVKLIAEGKTIASKCSSRATFLDISYVDYEKNTDLKNEIFGPSTLSIKLNTNQEFYDAARKLEGQLTISVFCTKKDIQEFKELIYILELKAGRLIINGFPTGVEVCHSMHHGGPFPATTDSRSTSVGTAAIKRFLKPICYQDFSQDLLPDALKNDNPLNITRLVNGKLTKDKIKVNGE